MRDILLFFFTVFSLAVQGKEVSEASFLKLGEYDIATIAVIGLFILCWKLIDNKQKNSKD